MSRTVGQSDTKTRGRGASRCYCHPHTPFGSPGRLHRCHSYPLNRTLARPTDHRYRCLRCKYHRGSRTDTRSGHCTRLARSRTHRRGNRWRRWRADTHAHRWALPSTSIPRWPGRSRFWRRFPSQAARPTAAVSVGVDLLRASLSDPASPASLLIRRDRLRCQLLAGNRVFFPAGTRVPTAGRWACYLTAPNFPG